MPNYGYRCQDCIEGYEIERFFPFAEYTRRIDCPSCGGDAYVVFSSPRIQKSSLQHEARYDHSLGAVVSGQKDREELAKKIGDKEGRTIVFADPQDTKALGVSDEGLHETRRRKHDTGEQLSTTKHL